MDVGILIVIAIPLIVALVVWAGSAERVYRESFWWDTNNGLNYSSSSLYKLKWVSLYYISHDENYKHPTKHPEYKEFLNKVKDIKESK